jgi:hypothetical protein
MHGRCGKTAVAMEEFMAHSKRLHEWLNTLNTMQKCDFSPEKKQKLRPHGMIAEITLIGLSRNGTEMETLKSTPR